MGQDISTLSPTSTLTVEGAFSDLPGYTYQQRVGGARFLKTVLATHHEGLAIVKFFIKPSPDRSLQSYAKSITNECTQLRHIPNLLPYARILESDKAGILIRQYLPSNLYDRISTRPFLSTFEKIWLAYQILCALRATHEKGICHGDIKTENVLVTSWNWAMLTDFSHSFKPTILPDDNPANYSFYFDTSLRRSCYIAPERFTSTPEAGRNTQESLTPEMDIFSLGCVLAELFLEGHAIFTLSQLLQFKAQKYDPTPELSKIEPEGMAEMISHMLQLEPGKRMSASAYLKKFRGRVFPEYFYTFLHPYMSIMADSKRLISSAMKGNILVCMKVLGKRQQVEVDTLSSSLATATPQRITQYAIAVSPGDYGMNESDCKVQKIFEDFDEILQAMGLATPTDPSARKSSTGAIFFIDILCACLRNLSYPSSQLRCLRLFTSFSPYVEDDITLDRLVPYILSLMETSSALVRSQALTTVTKLLQDVHEPSHSELNIFPEYIFPCLSKIYLDSVTLVRETYAKCLPELAALAHRFLDKAETERAQRTEDEECADLEVSYNTRLSELQGWLEEQLVALLTDKDTSVKRCLVVHLAPLCRTLGQLKTNEILLKHITTYLNDKDWNLRSAFFESIATLATYLGPRSLEQFILPLIMQALADPEEFVVERALHTLTELTSARFLTTMKLREIVRHVASLLCHPNTWIRYETVGFIAAAGRQLTRAEATSLLLPELRDYQASKVQDLTELALLETLNAPLSRHLYNQAVGYIMKKKRHSDAANAMQKPRAAHHHANHDITEMIDRLRHLKLSTDDEKKLAGLYRFIVKDSAVLNKHPDDASLSLLNGDVVSLKALGATPNTEFLVPLPVLKERKVKNVWRIKPPQSRRRLAAALSGLREAPAKGKLLAAATQPLSPISTGSLESNNRDSLVSSSSPTHSVSSAADAAPSVRTTTSLASASTGPPYTPSVAPSTPSSVATPSLQRRMSTLRLIASATASPSQPEGAVVPGVNATHGGASSSHVAKAEAATGTSVLTAKADFGKRRRGREREDVPVLVDKRDINLSPYYPGTTASVPSGLGSHGREILQLSRSPSGPARVLLEHEQLPYRTLNAFLQALFITQTEEYFPVQVVDLGPRMSHNRQSSPSRRLGDWRPEGGLISHLTEHTAAVNELSVSSDHTMFASASDDGTVKIWDSVRLERNVSNRSKLTYRAPRGGIRCMKWCQSNRAIACGCESGAVQVFRIDHEKSSTSPARTLRTCVVLQRNMDNDREFPTLMDQFNDANKSLLLYATNLNYATCLDLRSSKEAFSFRLPYLYGHLTAMTASRSQPWIAFGTVRGVISVWDARYLRPLRQFLHPVPGRIHRLVTTWESDEYVYCSSGEHHVTLWDLGKNACIRCVTTCPNVAEGMPNGFVPRPVPSRSELMKPRQYPLGGPSGVRGVCNPDATHALITGGIDRRLRFWDTVDPSRSFVMSGGGGCVEVGKVGRPTYAVANRGATVVQYETGMLQGVGGASAGGVPVSGAFRPLSSSSSPGPPLSLLSLSSTPCATSSHPPSSSTNPAVPLRPPHDRNPLHHVDAITDVQVIDIGFPIVVSAGRDSVIKVWK